MTSKPLPLLRIPLCHLQPWHFWWPFGESGASRSCTQEHELAGFQHGAGLWDLITHYTKMRILFILHSSHLAQEVAPDPGDGRFPKDQASPFSWDPHQDLKPSM